MEQPQENKTEQQPNEVKKGVKKKPQVKSKPTEGGRARAKTTLFELKNKTTETTNKIKVEGIGESKFTNLLSMFDKKKEENTNINENNNKPQPGKLDMQRFSMNNNLNSSNKKSIDVKELGGMSIQERLAKLKEEGEKTKPKTSTVLDPVLQQNYECDENEDYEEDNEENLSLNDDEEDLALSDTEEYNVKDNENKKEEVNKENTNEENINCEKKIINKDVNVNDDGLGGDDEVVEVEAKEEI